MCGGPPPKENTDVCVNDWCLFNLKNDPCEYNNVLLQFPNIVQQLKHRIQQLSKTTVLTWVNFSKKDIQRYVFFFFFFFFFFFLLNHL